MKKGNIAQSCFHSTNINGIVGRQNNVNNGAGKEAKAANNVWKNGPAVVVIDM